MSGDIPTVVKKLPASTASDLSDQLIMETKVKIIEILQVAFVSFASGYVQFTVKLQLLKRILSRVHLT